MRRWARPRSLAGAAAAVAAIASCRGGLRRAPEPVVRGGVARDTLPRDTVAGDTAFPMMPGPGRRPRGAAIRVAVATGAGTARVAADGRWALLDRDGALVATAGTGERWSGVARGARHPATRPGAGWSARTVS